MNHSTKQCIFGSHIFRISSESAVCALSLSPSVVSLPLRARLVTGSTPLLSATFVLEVSISRVPRSKGRLPREEGAGAGEQGREVGS